MKSREEYIECFRVECYDTEKKQFQTEIMQNLAENRDKYIQLMQEAIKKFMHEIGKAQIMEYIPVGCIEISFLRLSVNEESLDMVFEANDIEQDFGECVASSYIKLDWFSDEWVNFKNRLEKKRIMDKWAGNISKADILNMLQDTLYDFFVTLTFFYKYNLNNCREWQEYQELVRTKYFYISMGEYRDWQKKLFVDRESFDIFQVEQGSSLRYGLFEKTIYHRKEFRKMDLKGSQFVKATFKNCQFYNVKMQDSMFKDCQFINCQFHGIDFSGSIFEECIFERCIMEEVTWFENVTFPRDTFDDLYRKTALISSCLKNCTIDQEKLEKCNLIQTDVTGKQ